MKDFDSYSCSLSGNHIVEAGAGTGKTYNIQILVARMVLAGTPIARILVVTFTRNATAELRERIRGVLIELIDALRSDTITEGSRAALLLKDIDHQIALERLMVALRDFDSAAIYTIDAFCIRMLNENAFESNRRYNITICPDVSDLVKTAVNDFVRRVFFVQGSSADADFAYRQFAYPHSGITANELLESCNKAFNDSYAKCDYGDDVEGQDCTTAAKACYDEFIKSCEAAARILDYSVEKQPINERELWQQYVAELKTFLFEARGVLCTTKGEMRKQTKPAREAVEASRYNFASEGAAWFAGTKSSVPIDVAHDFLCQDALSRFKRVVKAQAAREVREAVQALKDANGVLTYNDSLTQMCEALKAPDSTLCEVVRKRYACAIVDEFQDTNEGQYVVFKRIFGDSPEHAFFMIGDPKQAIYSFRGGDIFSYLTARNDVDEEENRHTLRRNFRSSPAFIDAMNKFFGTLGYEYFKIFEDEADGIEFNPILPGDKTNALTIDLSGGDTWPLLSCGSDAVSNNDRAVDATVAEVCALLAQREHIQVAGEPLSAKHIAVLVRNNETGSNIEAELLKRGVNCCLHGATGLFARAEAAQLLTILKAIDEPNRRESVMALLALPLFNFDMATLKRFHDEDAGAVQVILTDLREQWEESTFLQMYNRFMRLTLGDLLGSEAEDGERTIAQLMVGRRGECELPIWKQLGEVLHYVAITEHYGIAETINWLREAIHGNEKKDASEDELEQQLTKIRMRTQDDAVTIMTIHKSKGLQFPIVFLPRIGKYKWKGKNNRYHDEEGIRRQVMDTADENVQERCDGEAQAEMRRLLYVAITRAQYMFRLVGGLEDLFENVDTPPAIEHVEMPVWCNAPAPAVAPEQSASAMAEYEYFDAHCPRGWQTCSYSSLSKSGKSTATAPVEDVPSNPNLQGDDEPDIPPVQSAAGEEEEAEVASEESLAVFKFARGAAAGKVWHKLFEELDYQERDDAVLRDWLVTELDRYHQLPHEDSDVELRNAMIEAAFAMARGVTDNALPGTSVKLCEVPSSQRRHEMNFKFRLGGGNGIDCTAVRKVLLDRAIAVPDGWFVKDSAETTADMLTYRDFTLVGDIDLIFQSQDKFWIVDWKTNTLCKYGEMPSLERFEPRSPNCAMGAEMNEHFYTLQYLIYTVAFMQWYASLHRGFVWTEATYDELFGGCCYVFLRGVSQAHPDRGFFSARPQWSLIEQLYHILGRER
jgi:exodeoxyribonuclease V beta subunit